jgi:hypothetical protein
MEAVWPRGSRAHLMRRLKFWFQQYCVGLPNERS